MSVAQTPYRRRTSRVGLASGPGLPPAPADRGPGVPERPPSPRRTSGRSTRRGLAPRRVSHLSPPSSGAGVPRGWGVKPPDPPGCVPLRGPAGWSGFDHCPHVVGVERVGYERVDGACTPKPVTVGPVTRVRPVVSTRLLEAVRGGCHAVLYRARFAPTPPGDAWGGGCGRGDRRSGQRGTNWRTPTSGTRPPGPGGALAESWSGRMVHPPGPDAEALGAAPRRR